MAGVCLVIFYNPLNNNCRFFTFMNDIPKREFNRGMQYVLVEAVIQMGMSFVLLTFLRKKLGVDVFRVGAYTLKRTPLCFWWTSLLCCVYFLGIYLVHWGVDDTFKFPWLFAKNGTTYIPEGAFSGVCQLFNFENATSGLEEFGWDECEAKFPWIEAVGSQECGWEECNAMFTCEG